MSCRTRSSMFGASWKGEPQFGSNLLHSRDPAPSSLQQNNTKKRETTSMGEDVPSLRQIHEVGAWLLGSREIAKDTVAMWFVY